MVYCIASDYLHHGLVSYDRNQGKYHATPYFWLSTMLNKSSTVPYLPRFSIFIRNLLMQSGHRKKPSACGPHHSL